MRWRRCAPSSPTSSPLRAPPPAARGVVCRIRFLFFPVISTNVDAKGRVALMAHADRVGGGSIIHRHDGERTLDAVEDHRDLDAIRRAGTGWDIAAGSENRGDGKQRR